METQEYNPLGRYFVTGTGSSDSTQNHGIVIDGDDDQDISEIMSVLGNISLNGNGQGTSISNHGIYLKTQRS